MIYSTAGRIRGPVEEAQGTAPDARAAASPRAGATSSRRAARTLGRSRECDVVLSDANVSRRHAEVRAGRGRHVDDRRPRLDERRARQRAPDRGRRAAAPRATAIALGTAEIAFELE